MSHDARRVHCAAQVREPGGPVLVAPVMAREPGPGEVPLDVVASGICGADAGMAVDPSPANGFPLTPGHEVAGVIAELGQGAHGWEIGERAGVGWFGGSCGSCTACRSGDVVHCPRRQIPGLSYPGGWASTVTDQLTDLFGPAAARPGTLHVRDWSTEHWTSPPDVHRLGDYSLFGHALYQQPILNGRLHWASTETTTGYAGHVEGALFGGERAARAILTALSAPAANTPGHAQSPAPLTHR